MIPLPLILLLAALVFFLAPHRAHRDIVDEGWGQGNARALLVAHQAARSWEISNPAYSGTLPATPISSIALNAASYISCAGGKIVVTYYSGPMHGSTPADILAAASPLNAGDLNMGLGAGSATLSTIDGRSIGLPCSVPLGEPAIFTQYEP